MFGWKDYGRYRGNDIDREFVFPLPLHLVGKLLMKNMEVLLYKRLSVEHGTGKEMRISHLDSHLPYVSNDEDRLLTVEAAKDFVNNPIQSCLFHA